MKKKPGKSFAEDWAKNTYTGRAVKAVVDKFSGPKFGAPSSNIEDQRNEAPGKGDRQNSPQSPMQTYNKAERLQRNFFSAKRLKKL